MIDKNNLKMRLSYFTISSLLCLFAVPILFQNCSSPLQESGDWKSVAASAPFAYETKMNYLAYMSCTGNRTDNDIFTFKIMATDVWGTQGGLRLTPDFVYAARNLAVPDKILALSESDLNSSVYMTLNLRNASNLSLYTTTMSNSPTQELFIGPLSEASNAATLGNANGSKYIANFPLFQNDKVSGGGVVRGVKHYTQNESTASTIRTAISNGSAILAVTFAQGDIARTIGPKGNSGPTAYGLGYSMSFEQGFRLNDSYNPTDKFAVYGTGNRVMKAASEKNLDSGQVATWNCASSMRFMVVRNADQANNNLLCPEDENVAVYSEPAVALGILKFALPAGWKINIKKHCVVPPASADSCYVANASINYNSSTTCDPNSATNACPHYISVCARP